MNKKMENLYAEINTLFRWVADLEEQHKENPEETNTELLKALGFRIIDLTFELDIARIEYQNQPLWKRLLKK
jgi:hypothetical protein